MLVEDRGARPASGHIPHRPPRRLVGYSRPPISSDELTSWRAYERVTGTLGPERDDQLSTLNAFYVVRALGAKKAKLDKMMPRWFRPAQSWQDIKSAFRSIASAFGSEDVNRG